MSTSLSQEAIAAATSGLAEENAAFARRFPGTADVSKREGLFQPVHVVYGGAHLFRADTAVKLGKAARRSIDEHAPDVASFAAVFGVREEIAEVVRARVIAKLDREAVEDLRIDFEDGYGARADEEEDEHATSAAREVAKGLEDGSLPPLSGIRVKPLDEACRARSIRTLDRFFTALSEATGGRAPEGFVVTLPKITIPAHVRALANLLDRLENKLGMKEGAIGIELMVETPQVIFSLPALHEAGRGRVVAAHFGAYDYTAACGVVAARQGLAHPACDFARQMMVISFAGTGVRVSDGATTMLPIGPHRGDALTDAQRAENTSVVRRAWRAHHDNVRRALDHGIAQGWDLHPAQLPARYAAVHGFYLDVIEEAGDRLRRFVREAARATQHGGVFDDAATGQGLLNVFLGALRSGAIDEAEATRATSLGVEELRARSFAAIVARARGV